MSNTDTLDHILMLKCFFQGDWELTSAAYPMRYTKCQLQWLWSGTSEDGQCHLSWLTCLIFQNTKSLDLINFQQRKNWKLWKRTVCLLKRQNGDTNKKIAVSGRTDILSGSCSAFEPWEGLALVAPRQLRLITGMGRSFAQSVWVRVPSPHPLQGIWRKKAAVFQRGNS